MGRLRSAVPARARPRRASRPPTGRIASLEQVLAYENPDVVAKFRESWALDAEEADELFRDVLRFLWLSARTGRLRDRPAMNVFTGQELLDEMWHTFVLFMGDYQRFCRRYFGRVLLHRPARASEPAPPPGEVARQLRQMIGRVYDELGEDVAIRFFRTYPRKHGPERLEALRIPFTARRGPRDETASRDHRAEERAS